MMVSNDIGIYTDDTPKVGDCNRNPSEYEHPLEEVYVSEKTMASGDQLYTDLWMNAEFRLDPHVQQVARDRETIYQREKATVCDGIEIDRVILQDIDDGAGGVVGIYDEKVTCKKKEGLPKPADVLAGFPQLLWPHR